MHPISDQQRDGRARVGARLGFVGAVLVVLGLVLCVAYRFTASDEPHSYASGAVAPYDVQVTQGRTYHVAIHRGVDAERDLGLVPEALTCTYSVQAGVDRPLTLAAETSGTKATNVIATFAAPLSGRVHVACTGLADVFVDDADNAPADRSGLALLLGVIALAVGVPLGLSGLRTLYASAASDGSAGPDRFGEDDQVE